MTNADCRLVIQFIIASITVWLELTIMNHYEPFITTIRCLHFKGFKPAYSIANLGGLYYLHAYLQSKE